jgi:hypothetical protein
MMRKLLMIFLLLIFLPSLGFTQKDIGEYGKAVIAELPTLECERWLLNYLSTLIPDGFEVINVKDEADAKDEKFWAVFRVSCSKSEVRTEWMSRRWAEYRTITIQLQPRDKIFATNWEYVYVRGHKRPGPSSDSFDWDIKKEWTEVPKLEITINTSDVNTLLTVFKGYRGAIRFAALERLQKITGQNFGEDYKKWEDWWEKNKGK